jgi:hypothetical protein
MTYSWDRHPRYPTDAFLALRFLGHIKPSDRKHHLENVSNINTLLHGWSRVGVAVMHLSHIVAMSSLCSSRHLIVTAIKTALWWEQTRNISRAHPISQADHRMTPETPVEPLHLHTLPNLALFLLLLLHLKVLSMCVGRSFCECE